MQNRCPEGSPPRETEAGKKKTKKDIKKRESNSYLQKREFGRTTDDSLKSFEPFQFEFVETI